MVESKCWVLANNPLGMPKVADFECITEHLPSCSNDGGGSIRIINNS